MEDISLTALKCGHNQFNLVSALLRAFQYCCADRRQARMSTKPLRAALLEFTADFPTLEADVRTVLMLDSMTSVAEQLDRLVKSNVSGVEQARSDLLERAKHLLDYSLIGTSAQSENEPQITKRRRRSVDHANSASRNMTRANFGHAIFASILTQVEIDEVVKKKAPITL